MLNPVMVQIGPRDTGQGKPMIGERPASVALGRCFGLRQPQPRAKEAVRAAVHQCRQDAPRKRCRCQH
jgi:hypothetical protein